MTILLAVLTLALPLFAESQKEAELRARLEASEVARKADKAILATALAALAKSAAPKEATTPAQSAKVAAEGAAAILDVNKKAADSARAAAETASAQSEQVRALLKSNFASVLLTQIGLVVIGGLGFAGAWLVALRDRAWARKDAAEARSAVTVQGAKLDQIHALVNSSMTEAIEKELLATELNLTLLEELAQATGKAPSRVAAERIATTKIQIGELKAKLADRLKQTTAAAAQLSVDLKKA